MQKVCFPELNINSGRTPTAEICKFIGSRYEVMEVAGNRRIVTLKEAAGGQLNSHYMDGDISELSVYKQGGNVQRGSPSYTAVRSTSLVEYLARGLWGRLHLHNSIKASFSLPLYLYLARSRRDTCVGKKL